MIDNNYIKIDLINDLSNILKDDITEMGYDMSTIAHDKILLLYNELLMRLIVPCKRKIEIAKEFSCPAELETGLEQLKQKIIDGESKDKPNIIDLTIPVNGVAYHFHLTEIPK